MAPGLNKNKGADGKVHHEGNIKGGKVPRKAKAGLSKAGTKVNSLPQPGSGLAGATAAGASLRKGSRRRVPGPTLGPLG